MDENAQSFSHSHLYYSQPESPKIYLPKPAASSSSGLTLVIPSLKSLKASQSANRASAGKQRTPAHHSVFHDADIQEKKIPRPVKLKPLKEVLAKLIAQLKKKDDYAFFLHPVDVANVPGYSDIVKRPMDLGTMSDKVAKGKYRSLEDFASDFRLVTNNAKMFNPPGTIYHTEADRLEAWGLDHISKAAATVIQYETDWNIEIEKDEDVAPVNIDEDDEDNANNNNNETPMEVDAPSVRGERSVSVVSQVQPSTAVGVSGRRGPRGPYKKQSQAGNTLSETLEADGGLPGSKDGLGSFPAGSDWAKTMVALKLKGKRYKTKKERLRIEREGPPLLADGSLDYTEMEDPFSVLSYFVPDPPSRPHLVPLYPPFHNFANATVPPPPPATGSTSTSGLSTYPPPQQQIQQQQQQNVIDPSSSQVHTPQSLSQVPTGTAGTPVPGPAPISFNASSSSVAAAGGAQTVVAFPGPTAVPLDHPPLVLPFVTQDQTQKPSQTAANAANANVNGTQKPLAQAQAQQPRRRHWTITRGGTTRQKGKEREDSSTMYSLYDPQYPYPYPGQPPTQLDTSGRPIQILYDAAGRPVKGNERPAWQAPREAHAVDFGSFAVLGGEVREDAGREGVLGRTPATGVGVGMGGEGMGVGQAQGQAQGRDKEQDLMFDLIRESLDCESAVKRMEAASSAQANNIPLASSYSTGTSTSSAGGYWTNKRAAEAEEYIKDVVYGGVDGFAYVRSLAEFVDGRTFLTKEDYEDVDGELEGAERAAGTNERRYNPRLGMSLAKWVETNVVDPLTEGRHSLLREAALEIARQQSASTSASHSSSNNVPPPPATTDLNLADDPRVGTVASQVAASLRLYPSALMAMSALLHIRMHKIDMGALIKTPNELFLSEEEWIGKVMKERRRERASAKGVEKQEKESGKKEGGKVRKEDAMAMQVEEEEEEEEEEELEQTWAGVDASLKDRDMANGNGSARPAGYEQEGPEELNEVLEYVAGVIAELDKRTREKRNEARLKAATATLSASGGDSDAMQVDSVMKTEDTTRAVPPAPPPSPAEDPVIRNLRLNLLALAKRAPLDTIARLPKDLVPEHIRHFVPTLGSSG